MPRTGSKTAVLGFVSLAALLGASACSSGGGGLNFGGGGAPGSGIGTAEAGGGDGSGDGSGSGPVDAGTDTADAGGGAGADAGAGGADSGSGAGSGSDSADASVSDDGAFGTASSGTLERVVDTAAPIVTAGNALLPGASGAISGAAASGDEVLNPVAAVTVADEQVVGSGAADAEQLVAINAASDDEESTEGQLATLNIAQDGAILALDVDGDGVIGQSEQALAGAQSVLARQNALAGSVGGATVGGGNAAVGLSALSPTQQTGTLATAGIDSGGQTATLAAGGAALTNAAAGPAAGVVPGGGLTAAAGTAASNLVGAGVLTGAPPSTLATATALTGGQAATLDVTGGAITGGQQLLSGQVDSATVGGNPALVGVGALTPAQPVGSALTAGAANGGQTVTLRLPGQ